MNAVVEWLATVIRSADSLGAWILWIALLLTLGALPSLIPRRDTDRGPRGVLSMWAGLLAAAVIVVRGEAILSALGRAWTATTRSAGAHADRLDPLFARLPDGASGWLLQLPWREIAVAALLLMLVAAFYLPRHSRFGHGR